MTILKFLPVLIRLWPIIRPILPALLKLVEENRHLLRENLRRPGTGPAEDARDFFREMDSNRKWDPFDDGGG